MAVIVVFDALVERFCVFLGQRLVCSSSGRLLNARRTGTSRRLFALRRGHGSVHDSFGDGSVGVGQAERQRNVQACRGLAAPSAVNLRATVSCGCASVLFRVTTELCKPSAGFFIGF